MKYMLMMHAPRAGWTTAGIGTWPPEDITAHIGFMMRFSKELKENFSGGGDKAEQLAINALTATAGQLAHIETVQIFIDGAVVETLGGSQSLLRPLKVPPKN